MCVCANALSLIDISKVLCELAHGLTKPKQISPLPRPLSLISSLLLLILLPPLPLLCFAGCEVDVLPVRSLHPAGGAADAEHHGGVRLAHLLHRHVQVPRLPGVHQHPQDDGGQQVGWPRLTRRLK